MNPETYNTDFPPYLTPQPSPYYPPTTKNQPSTPQSLPQQTAMDLTQAHTDTSQKGYSGNTDSTRAMQGRTPNQPGLPQSSESWLTVSRKRIRNVDEHDHPHAKKTDYWLGETVTTTNRFSTLTEGATEETTPLQSTRNINHPRYLYLE